MNPSGQLFTPKTVKQCARLGTYGVTPLTNKSNRRDEDESILDQTQTIMLSVQTELEFPICNNEQLIAMQYETRVTFHYGPF